MREAKKKMADRADLILEIGCEELPPGVVDEGPRQLAEAVKGLLDALELSYGDVRTAGTPRRLGVYVASVQVRQDDREQVVLGPPVKLAFDEHGNPTRAAIGFARAQGASIEQLSRAQGPRGEVVAVRRLRKGRATLELLAEGLPKVLAGLSFPRSMRWDRGLGPFVRPVHWILCLLGREVVRFEFAGVTSGRCTAGHRFLCRGPHELEMASDYFRVLEKAYVIADVATRKGVILERMRELEKDLAEKNETRRARFLKREELLTEVTCIVEYPILSLGRFPKEFLELPSEVLVAAMTSHQRYFPVEDEKGRLLPVFGMVSNTRARDMAAVVHGNERVLRARLYDARFFFDQDLRTGIDNMAERLGEVVFLRGLGTMADKAERLRTIVSDLCGALGMPADAREKARVAAALCKADLVSAMVGEFPELQGVMGMHYARRAGYDEAVAKAIGEHYCPAFAGDQLPESEIGAILSVADKADSLTLCFRAGMAPTGARDPLGLRRQGSGLLRIMIARAWPGLTLPRLLEIAGSDAGTFRGLLQFLRERFVGILDSDYRVRKDFADAVLERLDETIPGEVVARARALEGMAKSTDDFGDFLDTVVKRVWKLLRQADQKVPGWRKSAETQGFVRPSRGSPHGYLERFEDLLMQGVEPRLKGECLHPLERELCHRVEQALPVAKESKLDAGNRSRSTSREFEDWLREMYGFKGVLGRFLGSGRDGVPVLVAEDERDRFRRLALLQHVLDLFFWFADFSKISTR